MYKEIYKQTSIIIRVQCLKLVGAKKLSSVKEYPL